MNKDAAHIKDVLPDVTGLYAIAIVCLYNPIVSVKIV